MGFCAALAGYYSKQAPWARLSWFSSPWGPAARALRTKSEVPSAENLGEDAACGRGKLDPENGRYRRRDVHGVDDPDPRAASNVSPDGHERCVHEGSSLTLEHIEEGAQVKVRGVRETAPDGSEQVFAQEIKLQDDEDYVEDDGKVTICHMPPGNTENAKTITISESAVAAHLAHGDSLGTCP